MRPGKAGQEEDAARRHPWNSHPAARAGRPASSPGPGRTATIPEPIQPAGEAAGIKEPRLTPAT